MNAADFFAAAAKFPVGTLDDVTGGRGLVVVAPHPDDESLGCGGLIAVACARGGAVRVIVVSDGVGSHPNSKRFPPQRLRALREEETRGAATALGLDAAAIRFLRLPDRHVPTEGAEAEAASEAIRAAAQEIDAGAICVTWRHDPHCDHTACAALVGAVQLSGVRVFSYPIWGQTLPSDTEVGPAPKGIRLDIRDHAAAKAAAIAAHRSQTTDLIDDDPDGFRLMPEDIARFTGDYEILIEAEPSEPDRHARSLPAAYFDDIYARDPDPWRFASSPYEAEKYDATLAALPRTHYHAALEIGCSIGVLTKMLACRAHSLLAVDVAGRALDEAERRCAGIENIRFELMTVPEQWPAGRFDLIVLSEVVYYLDALDVAKLAERVGTSLMPHGDVVLVHWLGQTHYPLSGREAADLFTASIAAWAVVPTNRIETSDYRLDVLRASGSA